MDMQWSLIWQHSNASHARNKPDAFADPLDRPEWQGLVWVPVLAASMPRRLAALKSAWPAWGRAPLQREPSTDHEVCVS